MPDFSIENEFNGIIAGIDEVGRGPLAGSVVASAVIINQNEIPTSLTLELNDSKKLTAKKREYLFQILTNASYIKYGIGSADVLEIDKINILQASLLAMQRAFNNLPIKPDVALIDGNKAPKIDCQTRTVIGGDAKSLSIAAASIIAKVTRDNIMVAIAKEYPHYGFEKNAGYGTKAHIEAINKHGITPYHRKTFAPIKNMVF